MRNRRSPAFWRAALAGAVLFIIGSLVVAWADIPTITVLWGVGVVLVIFYPSYLPTVRKLTRRQPRS